MFYPQRFGFVLQPEDGRERIEQSDVCNVCLDGHDGTPGGVLLRELPEILGESCRYSFRWLMAA
jgi:hypothetical protein